VGGVILSTAKDPLARSLSKPQMLGVEERAAELTSRVDEQRSDDDNDVDEFRNGFEES
jgi:hypothetical protein